MKPRRNPLRKTSTGTGRPTKKTGDVASLPKQPRPKSPTGGATTEAAPELDATPAAAARALSGSQRRHLRGLGHHISPVVIVGKEGLTPSIVAATARALLTHELIKLKILGDAPVNRHALATQLAEDTQSAVVQVLGGTILFYKAHPKNPVIELPKRA